MGFEFRFVLDRCGSGCSFVGGLSRMDNGGLSFLDRGWTMVPVGFSSSIKFARALGHVPPFLASFCASLFFRRDRFRTLPVSFTEWRNVFLFIEGQRKLIRKNLWKLRWIERNWSPLSIVKC